MESKRYKNVSAFRQLDLEPGDEGEFELSPEEEARLVARGAVEVVGGEPYEGTEAPEETATETVPGDDSPEAAVDTNDQEE